MEGIVGCQTAQVSDLTHAGFIRLAHAVDAGRPVDTPAVVACRYGTSLCPE